MHDHVRPPERSAEIAEHASQDRAGASKRQVRDDRERTCRPFPFERVGLDHRYGAIRVEAPAQLSGEAGSKLERKHLGTGISQRSCQGARTGPDVDDEITGRDARLADEVGCEPAATKKMPSGRTLYGTPPNGPGRPPSSWLRFYALAVGKRVGVLVCRPLSAHDLATVGVVDPDERALRVARLEEEALERNSAAMP